MAFYRHRWPRQIQFYENILFIFKHIDLFQITLTSFRVWKLRFMNFFSNDFFLAKNYNYVHHFSNYRGSAAHLLDIHN